MRRRATFLLPLLPLAAPRLGLAQGTAFPTRPLTLVIPFAPGGSNDIVGRLVAEGMGARLGQNIVVENRGGGGTVLGNQFVANAQPDGHTLLLGGSGSVISSLVQPRLPYDPQRAFAPIGYMGAAPGVLAVHPRVPARTLSELQAVGRRAANPLRYASPGVGTTGHVMGALVGLVLGIELEHVPYRGTGPALQDLLAGRVDMISNAAAPMRTYFEAGTLRAIAVAAKQRTEILPDVPSAAEQGFPEIDGATWYGLLTTAGTPPAIVAKLHEALNATLSDAEVKRRLLENGMEVQTSPTPEDFGRFIAAERDRWGDLVRRLNLRIE